MSVASDINSCLMQAKWDFAVGSDTGKHTEGREVYRLNSLRWANAGEDEDNYNFSVIETKNKVRGHGKTLVVRFYSQPGKDFEILGWGLDVTGVSQ